MTAPADRLSRGQLSKRTSCNIETIRFYEQIGLLPAPPRSRGGHRMYGNSDLRRLVFIRRSRELGFTLDEIRGLLRLVDGHNYTCAEVRDMTLVHLTEVKKKIADLKLLQKTLAGIVAKCAGDTVPECPVIDALFRSAA
jgi:MerR family mercuric resistance operon transcriptional regulator